MIAALPRWALLWLPLKKSAILPQKMLRNFAEEAGGFEEDDAAVALAAHFGAAQKEMVFSTGDGDIKEPPLFGIR